MGSYLFNESSSSILISFGAFFKKFIIRFCDSLTSNALMHRGYVVPGNGKEKNKMKKKEKRKKNLSESQ